MSNIPPPGQTPRGQQPQKDKEEGPDSLEKGQKSFKLPKKDEKDEKKGGEGDVMAEELKMADQAQQQVGQEAKTEALEKNAKVSRANVESVKQIGQFIARTVEQLNFGKVQQTEHASMIIAKTEDVPKVFAGSNLTMECKNGSLEIHFENFARPEYQDQAITMVELHQSELAQMVHRLHTRGITVAEMTIGDHQVAIPQAEQVLEPSPFQPPDRSEAQAEAQREQEETRDAGEDRP